ncbi:hypothetical protein NONO_c18030 [Nocardia nova SH22a]|uniref:Uncharacterized protein n=1 Tax=Nocardia nova SH22a TaxID=1415166 RepID=W5TC98_9NOCA|nr:hypothetical protein [Nocardia nova]AHH16603.1 hypothetical protein NONO_c18030 [Nocardia nova SH22a]
MPCLVVQPRSGGFLPSGMTKASTQSITAAQSTSYQQVVGWTADTANYPGSTTSGDALVAQSAHPGAKVSASVRMSSGITSTTTLRLKQNGTIIATGTASASSASRVATLDATGVAVAQGDLITVEAVQSAFTSHTVEVADTWVRILAP